MKLCIAEKPSVARDIAKVIGANKSANGYLEGNGYFVSWVFGHLCALKDPEDYDALWKNWRLEDLPILPEKFGIKLRKDSGVQKQFSIIQELLEKSTEVINCGDAGQEGELIQRWLLLKAKCTLPVKRLWISSLTEESIKNGFNSLRDAKDFDRLFSAGNARAVGDWMLGINGTRLFTKKFARDKSVLSVGRVQTPTLAMIVQRQEEINAFKVEIYWELKTIYRETEFTCQISRLKNLEKAQKGLEYIEGKLFEITDFEQKETKEGNPKLYDLTSLQVDANSYYGKSADQTLKTAQSLYEKKLITYPRVDTNYLSEDLHPKIHSILTRLTDYQKHVEPLVTKPIPKLPSVFDDKKITDHHAIIPTGIIANNLSQEESKVFDLICRRFIAVFYPSCTNSSTVVLGKIDELLFKASGKQEIDPGWKVVYKGFQGQKKTKNVKEEHRMPIFVIGESGPHQPLIHEGRTSPPKPYTEASLLRAMETAGKFVEDEELKEAMKDNGIGRPSTRASIIETLFRRKYIDKKRKNLFPTENGIRLIGLIQNELLKSPELTGQWESRLRQIEKGQFSGKEFIQDLSIMVRELVDDVLFNRNPN